MKQFLSSSPLATPVQILDELRLVSAFSALPPEERMFLFVSAAFGPDSVKQNLVKRYSKVLRGLILTVDGPAYQRRLIGTCATSGGDLGGQKVLFPPCGTDCQLFTVRLWTGTMEHLCGVRIPELLKWFPLVLKQLYDEDLVEEELFIEWFEEEGRTEFTRREVSDELVSSQGPVARGQARGGGWDRG